MAIWGWIVLGAMAVVLIVTIAVARYVLSIANDLLGGVILGLGGPDITGKKRR